MSENDQSKIDNRNDDQPETPEKAESQGKLKCDLDLIMDIPLDVSVELGSVKMLVNDLLQLGQGSIIELNKPVTEPLAILINKKLIARGEVVVVDEKFGVRLTHTVSPFERVKSLG